MASNLPSGTTQAMIDRYYDDEPEYEPDEQELEEIYLDRIEQEAELIPVPYFWECQAEPVAEQLKLDFAERKTTVRVELGREERRVA